MSDIEGKAAMVAASEFQLKIKKDEGREVES